MWINTDIIQDVALQCTKISTFCVTHWGRHQEYVQFRQRGVISEFFGKIMRHGSRNQVGEINGIIRGNQKRHR